MQENSRKQDTDSLVPETKIVDVGKLINFKNLLVRKVTFMLPTMSTPLIFVPCKINDVFGANHMTRISYIYSWLPITHSLTFWLSETAWLCQLMTPSSIHTTWVHLYSATFFFPVLPFRLDLFQSRAQPQTFHQIPKTCPSRIHCYISVYWYLTWNTWSTYIYSLQDTFNI